VDRSQSKANGNPAEIIRQQLGKQEIDAITKDLFEPPKVQTPSDKVSLPNVLIILPLGEKETITVSIEQARTIWLQLNSIFAK
jgi:hypothetical protein